MSFTIRRFCAVPPPISTPPRSERAPYAPDPATPESPRAGAGSAPGPTADSAEAEEGHEDGARQGSSGADVGGRGAHSELTPGTGDDAEDGQRPEAALPTDDDDMPPGGADEWLERDGWLDADVDSPPDGPDLEVAALSSSASSLDLGAENKGVEWEAMAMLDSDDSPPPRGARAGAAAPAELLCACDSCKRVRACRYPPCAFFWNRPRQRQLWARVSSSGVGGAAVHVYGASPARTRVGHTQGCNVAAPQHRSVAPTWGAALRAKYRADLLSSPNSMHLTWSTRAVALPPMAH